MLRVKRESPVYSVLFDDVYILPSCKNSNRLEFKLPPAISSFDTNGNNAGKWISPAWRLTILGLLKSITSSGVDAPDWLKLSKPKRFKNVLPLLDLSLIGVEKLSIILTSRLWASILVEPIE